MKQRNAFILICAALIVIPLVNYVVYATLISGVNSGPDLIAALQNGEISPGDITAISVLRQTQGIWPFTEAEYSQLLSARLSKQTAAHIVQAVRDSSVKGHLHRNHPTTLYTGILRFDTTAGDHFYVYYQVGVYEGRRFTQLNANTANSTNPNGATGYENVLFAELLKKHDPFHPSLDAALKERPANDR